VPAVCLLLPGLKASAAPQQGIHTQKQYHVPLVAATVHVFAYTGVGRARARQKVILHVGLWLQLWPSLCITNIDPSFHGFCCRCDNMRTAAVAALLLMGVCAVAAQKVTKPTV
jgi:hypothetical protein